MPPPSKAASGQGSHLINSQSAHFARRPLALRCRTPLSILSLSSSGDISEPTRPRPNTRKIIQERTPCAPQPIVACPSECINPTLQKPPYYLLPPHYLQSSVFVESCKVSSGKHEYAYQSTILALRFPRPAQTPRRDKIDRTRYFEFRI